MGVRVGIRGWATVEHPPRYCLLCQAESVLFQGTGANLSPSTNTLDLCSPNTASPPTVGALAFLKAGGWRFLLPAISDRTMFLLFAVYKLEPH